MKKELHEYWYYFGKCMPYPHQIRKGMKPRPPFKRFDTKEECQQYIDSGKTFNPMIQQIMQGVN